jgi:Flagellar biosynthesis protein, FliO
VLEILPQLLAVLAVFGLLGATLWWLRRRGAVQLAPTLPFRLSGRKSGPDKLLQRVEALQLSPTHALNLVRLGDRAILVGTSPAGFYLVESSSWKTLVPQKSEGQQ